MTSRWRLQAACHALAAGGVIAYPTEAVWGLGCEPANRHALARLIALKGRSPAKGLILVADTFDAVAPWVADPRDPALPQAFSTWPGPVTWVMPAAPTASPELTGGRGTVAVRISAHPVVRALCRAWGGALVSTSANAAGRAPARSALGIRRRFGSGIDALVPGETGGQLRPTEIRDLATGRLLRE